MTTDSDDPDGAGAADPAAAETPLRVVVTDGRGRARPADGLPGWLIRVAPRAARGDMALGAGRRRQDARPEPAVPRRRSPHGRVVVPGRRGRRRRARRAGAGWATSSSRRAWPAGRRAPAAVRWTWSTGASRCTDCCTCSATTTRVTTAKWSGWSAACGARAACAGRPGDPAAAVPARVRGRLRRDGAGGVQPADAAAAAPQTPSGSASRGCSASTWTSPCGCSRRRACCRPWRVVLAVALALRLAGDAAVARGAALAGLLLLVPVCTWVIPLVVARRQPERVIGALLPSFHAVARVLRAADGRGDRAAERPARRAGRRARGQRRGAGRRRQRRGRVPRPTSRTSASCCIRSSSSATPWCAR